LLIKTDSLIQRTPKDCLVTKIYWLPHTGVMHPLYVLNRVCCIWKSLITKGISKSNAFIIIRHPVENQVNWASGSNDQETKKTVSYYLALMQTNLHLECKHGYIF
jgi:hypothetical protein